MKNTFGTPLNSHHLTYPSDLDQANQHAVAIKPGSPKSDISTHFEVCKCCYTILQKHPLNMKFSPCQIEILGLEYSMFFEILKIIGVLVLIILLNTGIIMFHDAVVTSKELDQSLGFQIGISPIQNDFPTQKLSIISILGFIVHGIILLVINAVQNHRINKKYNKDINVSDHAIIVKNIPKGSDIADKIKSLFVSNFQNIQILSILPIHDWKEYSQQLDRVIKARAAWKKAKKTKNAEIDASQAMEQAIKKIEEVKKDTLMKKQQKFSGTAIVIFSSSQGKSQVVKAYKKNFFNRNILEASLGISEKSNKYEIYISDAPNPDEINWINLSQPQLSIISQTLPSVFIVLVIVGYFLLHFVCQFIFGRKLSPQQPENMMKGASIGSLVLLSVLSYILLPWIIRKIQQSEKCVSLTEFNAKLLNRYYASLIAIKVGVVFLVEWIFSQQIISFQSEISKSQYLAYCTIKSLTKLVIIDAIVMVLLSAIQPKSVVHQIKKILSKEIDELSQQEANCNAEEPEFELPERYSLGVFTVSFMFMCSDLIPLGLFVSLGFIICYYWITKFNFIKRSSLSKIRMNQKFVKNALFLLQLSLPLKPFLNILVGSLGKEVFLIPEIFMLIIGIAYVFIPKQPIDAFLLKILRFTSRNPEQQDQKQIHKINRIIKESYQIQYPSMNSNIETKLAHLNKIRGLTNKKMLVFKRNGHFTHRELDIGDTELLKRQTETQSAYQQKDQQISETDRNLSHA